MKKVLNIIGYISILTLPLICGFMFIELDMVTNIILGVTFFILCFIAYLRYKKYLGITLLKVVMSFILCFATAIGISNIRANIMMGKNIIKIEGTEVNEVNGNLDKGIWSYEVNARLHKRKKDMFSKTSQDVKVYFEDGKTKRGVLLDGFVISIDNKYYDIESID